MPTKVAAKKKLANPSKIFVNLPVADLKKSMAFYRKLGYKFNPQFTDKNAASMVIGEDIYVMLLVKKFFKGFTRKELINPRKQVQTLLALSFDNRAQVNRIVGRAVSAGGKAGKPVDLGSMYQWGFTDPDGHEWEPFWMDEKHIKKGKAR